MCNAASGLQEEPAKNLPVYISNCHMHLDHGLPWNLMDLPKSGGDKN